MGACCLAWAAEADGWLHGGVMPMLACCSWALAESRRTCPLVNGQPYQRHGIARRLLDQVFRHAAETACRAVYLHVATFNQAALAFYRRAGFRELAVLPGFYCIRCVWFVVRAGQGAAWKTGSRKSGRGSCSLAGRWRW